MIYRNYFGTWGRELSDSDFACALAVLGIIDNRIFGRLTIGNEYNLNYTEADLVKPVGWRFFRPLFTRTDFAPPDTPAAQLVEIWKSSALPGKARLEVDRASRFDRVDSVAMLAWIVAELSRPEVNARSVYLRVDRPNVTVGWRWPIRVGFLDDTTSQTLKSSLTSVIDGEKWMTPLVSTVDAVSSGSGCDLLILPFGLRQALANAAALSTPVRADCTIVLGSTEGDAAHWYRMLEGLRASIRTSGVAVTGHAMREPEKWFMDLIANLSHNNSIDVALFKSAEKRAAPPFMAMSHRLAEFSRISMQLRRTAEKMKRPSVRDITAMMPHEARDTVGSGPQSLDKVGDAMETAAMAGESTIESPGFIHERGGATGAAMATRAAHEAMTSAEPSPALEEPRFIQARVFDVTNRAEPVQLRHRFRRGAHHQINVRIGVPNAEWISTESGPAFPVDELPQDQDEWELTAVLSIAQSNEDPQMARFILPRFGNSREASFFIFVREEWKKVEARIVVLHRNRVMQTAMLEGSTGPHDDSDDTITLEPEVIAKTHFESLDTRERFDAALVINKSKDGVDRLLAISDDKVAHIPGASALNAEIGSIDSILAEIVDDPKKFIGKLTADGTVDLLRKLARHGNILYDHLVTDGGLDQFGTDGPLQLVAAVPDARLPIELVYERKSPKPTAELCPHAAVNLRKGKCDASCSDSATEKDFICPMAFWGLKRVIERHAYKPKLEKLTAGSAFAVVSEPTDLRPALDILKGGLIAGSQKVEKTVKGGLDDICKLVGGLTHSTLQPVPTWEKWTKGIKSSGPSLLMLIVHTEESPDDDTIPRMEIGEASWLEAPDIEAEHIVKEKGAPPLVLLIGCETGVPDRQFANFVSRIRSRGAAIVVATGAKIHSLHAVPVAKEFVNRIQEASKKKNTSFGDVMLAVRREMLADGIPMVLTLNAYGDADWRLARHS